MNKYLSSTYKKKKFYFDVVRLLINISDDSNRHTAVLSAKKGQEDFFKAFDEQRLKISSKIDTNYMDWKAESRVKRIRFL